MPKINFKKGFPSLEVRSKSNLMKSLLVAGRPVASSCGGDGICAKCGVQVVKGGKNLSPASFFEIERMQMNNIPKDCRLSCQCTVLGDITVDTDYW
ncbi:MAG: (2Fe-2S)-binding protein [Bdellovibrionaceae bacterium]|nr:(2Fe-2S)-binding protein [Pseudobdellovibrionaceae bacterium]